jgi:hypothetical protein
MESAMSMSQDDPRQNGVAAQAGDAVEKSATEASQGTKTGYMRWVLVFSLLLVVIVLGAAFVTYTAAHHQSEPTPATQAAMTPPPGAG